jgi:hypothetical protein
MDGLGETLIVVEIPLFTSMQYPAGRHIGLDPR